MRQIFCLGLILIGLMFTACRSENPSANQEFRQLTDQIGRRVKIKNRVERVVALTPDAAENAFFVGGGAKIVGVTSFADFPSEAQQIEKIGDTIRPNLEKIIALQPDIVLLSTASQLEAFAKALEEKQIPVFVTNPQTLEDIFKSLENYAEIFGTQETAAPKIAALRQRTAEIERQTNGRHRPKIFFQIERQGLYTVGKSSFVNDLIEKAGGANVAASIGDAFPQMSAENAAASLPEVIILPVNEGMGAENQLPSNVFKDSPAVKNNRIFKLDGDLLVRPTARLVEGLEQTAKVLDKAR